MTQLENNSNWKRQSYVMGATVGLLFGLISAYLFNRAAEDDAERSGGQPSRIQTGQLVGLLLAALGVARQVSELGKPRK